MDLPAAGPRVRREPGTPELCEPSHEGPRPMRWLFAPQRRVVFHGFKTETDPKVDWDKKLKRVQLFEARETCVFFTRGKDGQGRCWGGSRCLSARCELPGVAAESLTVCRSLPPCLCLRGCVCLSLCVSRNARSRRGTRSVGHRQPKCPSLSARAHTATLHALPL